MNVIRYIVVSLLMITGCNDSPVVIGGSTRQTQVAIPRVGPPLKSTSGDYVSSNTSPSDLIIKWSGDAAAITAVVDTLGGSIVQSVPQLNMFVARFNTTSPAQLQPTMDHLREHGYEASFDLLAPVMGQ